MVLSTCQPNTTQKVVFAHKNIKNLDLYPVRMRVSVIASSNG